MTIKTTMGLTTLDKLVYLNVPSLGENVECVVMDDTPEALSVGRLVARGWEFLWN